MSSSPAQPPATIVQKRGASDQRIDRAVLVVPDLHLNLEHAEYWINREYDRIVFLGDYFDAKDNSASNAGQMARWLRNHLHDPRFTFLMGNHDVHYRFPTSQEVRAPGFCRKAAEEINGVLKASDWKKMRMAYQAGVYLLSHAGFSPIWIQEPTIPKILARCDLAMARASRGELDPVLAYGELPGGLQRFGGPLWMDFSFFVGIPGINQIVGHTAGDDVRVKHFNESTNLCLDVGNGVIAALLRGDAIEVLRMDPGDPRSRVAGQTSSRSQ